MNNKQLRLSIVSVLLLIAANLAIGLIGYQAVKKIYFNEVNLRLEEQARSWRNLAETYDNEIFSQEKRVKISAENIVTAQAKMTFELLNHYFSVHDKKLPTNIEEDLKNRLARNMVGKSGYIWVLDYDGNYIVSKDRLRDGENIWETKDSSGNPVVQDLIRISRESPEGQITYHSYPWLNNGETEPRDKIAAMLHFPNQKWIVGISTYYDDLVDMSYRSRTIEHIKNMMPEERIGKTGYVWVVNSKGIYQVSRNRLRDGEDISQSKDADGRLFIQEAINRAKFAGLETDQISYRWSNKGEKKPKTELAGLAYMPEWDWIIGVSAPSDELEKETVQAVCRDLLIALIGAILINILFVYVHYKFVLKNEPLERSAG